MEFKRVSRRLSKRPDLAPMIDVVFFLLVFFMLFSSLRASMDSLDIELPQAVSDTTEHTSTFEISVNRNGAFYINGSMVTGIELRQSLEQALSRNPDLFVVIKGDRQAVYEYVIDAMDQVNDLGISRFGLAVESVR